MTGVKKLRTTPFHPQGDGQTGRMNKTLLQMLRATCQADPQNWPQMLDTVMAAYRMTVHKVTGITPNLAMLGREVLLLATLIAKPPEESVDVTVPFNKSIRDCLRSAHARVREASRTVAKTQKSYFDRSVKEIQFSVGQLVWLYWPSPPLRQKYRKLQWLWTGPWKIVSFQTDVVVNLVHTQQSVRQTVHVNRLVPCKGTDVRSPFASHAEESPTRSDQTFAESEHQTSAADAAPPSPPHPSLVDRPRRKRRLPVALEPYVLEV